MTLRVTAPAMTDAQLASWSGLLAVSSRVPDGWCLVGGQLVQLHCWERGASPNRPTDDGDAVIDVRARPDIVSVFTQALLDEGFRPLETSSTGVQHRWVNGDGVIDILIPRSLGVRANIKTALGGRPIATPGAQNVLERAERIRVELPNGTQGLIWRPTLQGALLAKSFAITVPLDREPERHLVDLAVLATMIAAPTRSARTSPRMSETSSATRS